MDKIWSEYVHSTYNGMIIYLKHASNDGNSLMLIFFFNYYLPSDYVIHHEFINFPAYITYILGKVRTCYVFLYGPQYYLL